MCNRGISRFDMIFLLCGVCTYWSACNVTPCMYLWHLKNIHIRIQTTRSCGSVCASHRNVLAHNQRLQAVLFFGSCASHAPAFTARTPIKQCRILLCVMCVAVAIANATASVVAVAGAAAVAALACVFLAMCVCVCICIGSKQRAYRTGNSLIWFCVSTFCGVPSSRTVAPWLFFFKKIKEIFNIFFCLIVCLQIWIQTIIKIFPAFTKRKFYFPILSRRTIKKKKKSTVKSGHSSDVSFFFLRKSFSRSLTGYGIFERCVARLSWNFHHFVCIKLCICEGFYSFYLARTARATETKKNRKFKFTRNTLDHA